jgi:threonine dehydrogenase-like Zn-dependent dehydrogenase
MLAFTVSRQKLRSIQKSLPNLRPRWALIRVRLAGICNTDVEILRGYHQFRGVPGHEFVGEVVEVVGVSSESRKRWLGQRVAGEINVSCSAYGRKPICDFCRRGLKTHCANRTVLGIVAHDGAFAEYLALPLENLHIIPANVTDEKAVFVEPLAAACQILHQLPIRKFSRAAVLGDGKLAQLIVRVLQSAGANVTLYGKHRAKLEMARQAGIATEQVRGDGSDMARTRESYPLVVEATGSATGLTLAQQLTEPRGTLLLKSTFHGTAPVATWPIVVKEITVLGSRCGPFVKAISLLRSDKVDPSSLISRTFALEDAPKAILYAQQPGVMKVLLQASARVGTVTKKKSPRREHHQQPRKE